jgi:Fe-S-cluster containining protein
MPGEADYIAAGLRVDKQEFRHMYLDGIITPYGVVDVLKIKPGCPFLSADFHCTIPNVKVVLCDVYPIVFQVHRNRVHFSLDPWCPIVRHVPELARQFEIKGIPAIVRLNCPVNWYRAVELYDSLCVDYDKLFALRVNDLGYVELTLEQVLTCQADNAPPPELSPQIKLITPSSSY